MGKKILSLLLVFCFLFSLAPAPAKGFAGSGAAGRQAILEELTALFGDEGAAGEALERLISLGLVDQKGRLRTGLKIELEGRRLTLEQAKDLLAAEGTDLSRKITVDGAVLTLGDLKVMLQIEAQLQQLQELLLGNPVELTAQHRASLQSLLAQIENEGISLLAEGDVDPLDYTSVNHEVYIKATVAFYDVEIPENRITANVMGLDSDYFSTRFELVDKDGDVLAPDDERLKGKEVSFQLRINQGSMRRNLRSLLYYTFDQGQEFKMLPDQNEVSYTLMHPHTFNRLDMLMPNHRWYGDQAAVIQLFNPQNALFYNEDAPPSRTKDIVVCHEVEENPWEPLMREADGTNLLYAASTHFFVGFPLTKNKPFTINLDDDPLYYDSRDQVDQSMHLRGYDPYDYLSSPYLDLLGDIRFQNPGMFFYEHMLAFYLADGIAPDGAGYEVQIGLTMNNKEITPPEFVKLDSIRYVPTFGFPPTDLPVDYSSSPAHPSPKITVSSDLSRWRHTFVWALFSGTDDTRLTLSPDLDRWDWADIYPIWDDIEPQQFNRITLQVEEDNIECHTASIRVIHQDTFAPELAGIAVDSYEYQSGQYVPITVSFSEPVKADGAKITVNGAVELTPAEQEGTMAPNLTFLYPVQKVDSTSLIVSSISGVEDMAGNSYDNTGFDPVTLCKDEDGEGMIKSTFLEEGWLGLSTDKSAYGAADGTGTVTIGLDQSEAFKTAYAGDFAISDESHSSETFYAHLLGTDGVRVGEPIPLCYAEEEGTGIISLSGEFDLPDPVGGDGVYALEFYKYGEDGGADPNDELLYGKYLLISKQGIILAQDSELSIPLVNGKDITVKGNWPSDEEKVVYMIGETATVLGFSYSGNATFQDPEYFEWSSSDESVAAIDPITDPANNLVAGRITPGTQAGEVTLTVSATDSGHAPPGHVPASASITVTVSAGGPPALVVPENSNIVRTYPGKEATVRWSTNVIAFNRGLKPPVNETYFTVSLFAGRIDDPSREASAGLIEEWSAPAVAGLVNATSFTVPGRFFETIHIKPEPSFTVKISTPDPRDPDDPARRLFAYAYIVVGSEPAQAKLARPAALYFADERDEGVVLSWELDRIDPTGSAAELRVDKNGEQVGEVVELEEMAHEGGQRYSGSRYLDFDDVPGDRVRDIYTVTLKAKNRGDGTWSYDSFVLYVYNQEMMQILVDGRAAESLLMSNAAGIGGRAAELAALPTSAEVMALREEVRLRGEIGIKQGPAGSNWNTLDDVMAWASGNSRVVSVNYKQGALYQNIEGYSYSCYLAATRFALSGINDGRAAITATHARTGMIDELAVTVETLTDQLYLFQFAPMQKTKLTYTDGAGLERTVYSNDEGALALYEPQGIASDMALESKTADGALYLGTIYRSNLVSGERDSTALLLYPLNYFKLRRVATVELFLKKEDGAPYSGEIYLTGGVMKNNAYCREAEINYKDGKTPRTYTPGADGRLTIEMDSTQFWSAELGDAPGAALTALDDLQFIYELNFPDDEYFPHLVYVNGNLNASETVRFADSIVTVKKTVPADIDQPFLAVQTIDYGVSKCHFMPVLDFTGLVGPGSSYPVATLRSTVMLWGFPADSCPPYSVGLYDEYGEYPRRQSNDLFVYEFSTIPLLRNSLVMDAATIWMEEGDPRGLELRLFDQAGRLLYSRPTTFRVANMMGATPIDESEEGGALLLTLKGSTDLGGGGEPGLGDQMLAGGLGMLSGLGMGGSMFKMIVSPTEDPMAFDAFIWAGKGSSGFAANEESGVFLEARTILEEGELSVVPSVSDMLGMAKGDYLEKQDKELGEAMDNDDKVTGSMDINTTLNGYFQARIRYNYQESKWELLILGGGFTAGIGLDYTWNYNNFVGPVPVTAYIKVGGEIGIDFKAAVRYAELAGHEWAEEITADNVNDYLITLRIAAYIRAFAGVGFDYSVVALKIGIFGQMDVDFQNALLSRSYLAAADKRLMHGQYLQLHGELGIEFMVKFLFISYEKVLASVSTGYTWFFSDWEDIQDYWKKTPSGLDALAAGPGLVEVSSRAVVESRDYLDENERRWKSLSPQRRSSFMPMAAAAPLQGLQDNAYPYANPELSDDGAILAYLSDGDSSDISHTEARFAVKSGGSYPDAGRAFPRAAGDYRGYGDSGLKLGGSGAFAAAAWVRQSEALAKGAGEEINADEQALMVNSTEIMASVYDGSSWSTFCLTANGSPDLAPAVAVGGGKVFVVWRNVYAADSENLTDFTLYDRILYRVYDGSDWSEAGTLYNGSSGPVKGLEAALAGETAAVAYTLDRSFAGDLSTYEIVYATIDLSDTGAPETTKNVQVSSDVYLDENPQLAAVKVEGEDRFVLGWHSRHSASGDEISDIRFCLFDAEGNLDPAFIDALSDVASQGGVNIGGDFRFVKMAASWNDLESLSLVWSEPAMRGDLEGLGDSGFDLLKAVKFISYGDGYGLSAPLTVAEMPERTLIDHYDAHITRGSGAGIAAVILGSEYKMIDPADPTTFTVYPGAGTRINEATGELEIVDIYVAKCEAKLYTAADTYGDRIAITGIGVDYAAARRNSPLPVQFAVLNRGLNTLTDIEITLDGVNSAFDGLSVRPNESVFLTLYHALGDPIRNVQYRVTANGGAITAEPDEEAVLFLEIPDVGISAVNTIREGEGMRSVQVSLYNESDVALAGSGCRVRLGIYSDLDCRDGEDNLVVEVEGQETEEFIIDSEADLALIDAGGYSRQLTFDVAAYLDRRLESWEEIPDYGVTLYFQVWIEEEMEVERGDPVFVEVPEYFRTNNTGSISFDSLLGRYGEPATLTTRVSLDGDGSTVAKVSVRNNSLSQKSSGNLIAVLLDDGGRVLKTMQSYSPPASLMKLAAPYLQSLGWFSPAGAGLITLGPEEWLEEEFNFGLSGYSVRVVYADLILHELSSAALSRLSFEGIPLKVDDFTAGEEGVYGVSYRGFSGSTLVTAVPEHPEADIFINGQPAPGGVAAVNVGATGATVITVRVVSADGSAERVYELLIENPPVVRYRITATAGAGGAITPGGTVSVEEGESRTFTITPYSDYRIEAVTVDGVNRGAVGSYTFSNVTGNHAIHAAFTYTGSGAEPGSRPRTPVVEESGAGGAEPGYRPRTLVDEESGIIVSGENIYKDAALIVEEMALHEAGSCAACDAIRERMQGSEFIFLLGWNISLSHGYIGPLTITIPVGEEDNGKTITVLHCHNGVIEERSGIVTGGSLTFSVSGLSPFALFAGAEKEPAPGPEPEGEEPGEAADRASGAAWWWLLAVIPLAALAVLAIANRKRFLRK